MSMPHKAMIGYEVLPYKMGYECYIYNPENGDNISPKFDNSICFFDWCKNNDCIVLSYEDAKEHIGSLLAVSKKYC